MPRVMIIFKDNNEKEKQKLNSSTTPSYIVMSIIKMYKYSQLN